MTKQANGRPLVLILEDEALIALNLQDELQDAGYDVPGPFTTCAAALGWLQTQTPNIAILDIALKDGSCRETALELSRREVPFLIYSGYHGDRQLLSEFQHINWIEKPVAPAVLTQACQQLQVESDQTTLG
jgi:DNA-binding response OmpR family regulator